MQVKRVAIGTAVFALSIAVLYGVVWCIGSLLMYLLGAVNAMLVIVLIPVILMVIMGGRIVADGIWGD